MSCKVANHAKRKSAIDDLPTDVIHKILEYLPIQDAAQTSILSKRWRQLWSTLPHLKFDPYFFQYVAIEETAGIIIHNILMHHTGPILGFHLISADDYVNYTDMDEWLIFVADHGLQKLTIDVPNEDIFDLPYEIFTCLTLTHLCVSNCYIKLPPPAFRGLDKLISMELYLSRIHPDVLESLSNEVIEINAPRLEILALDFDNLIDEVLEINAPRLRSLDFVGSILPISLKNSYLLEKLSVRKKFWYGQRNFVEFFKPFSTLEHLHLINIGVMISSAGDVEVPTRLPFNINCVKRLCLLKVDFGCSNAVSYALCLIRSLPYLQYLEIQVCNNGGGTPAPASVLEERFLDVTFSHLSEVKLEMHNRGREIDMQLIKLLLAKSPVLLRMFVEPGKFERYAHTPDQFVHKAFPLLAMISRFPRASPKAEVVYNVEDWLSK